MSRHACDCDLSGRVFPALTFQRVLLPVAPSASTRAVCWIGQNTAAMLTLKRLPFSLVAFSTFVLHLSHGLPTPTA